MASGWVVLGAKLPSDPVHPVVASCPALSPSPLCHLRPGLPLAGNSRSKSETYVPSGGFSAAYQALRAWDGGRKCCGDIPHGLRLWPGIHHSVIEPRKDINATPRVSLPRTGAYWWQADSTALPKNKQIKVSYIYPYVHVYTALGKQNGT